MLLCLTAIARLSTDLQMILLVTTPDFSTEGHQLPIPEPVHITKTQREDEVERMGKRFHPD